MAIALLDNCLGFKEGVQVKRPFRILLFCMCLLLVAGCSQRSTENGLFTQKNDTFDDNVSVKVDDAVIQACHEYIAKRGFESSKNNTYKSVLIGEEHLSAVYFEDESMRDMLDENDYVIIFGDVMQIVVDSDTKAIIGRIPLV